LGRKVQPEKFSTVIITIWRSGNRVNVAFSGFVIGKEHTGVVIELQHNHRRMNLVIEGALIPIRTNPGPIRVR